MNTIELRLQYAIQQAKNEQDRLERAIAIELPAAKKRVKELQALLEKMKDENVANVIKVLTTERLVEFPE
jgi:Ni,Fe-hydrogenase maturation factor